MQLYRLLNSDQMRYIDSDTISDDFEVGYSYMQQAAEGVYNLVLKSLDLDEEDGEIDYSMHKVNVFCGSGNNGGDGYLTALLLSQIGVDVDVFSLSNPSNLIGEAAMAFADFTEEGLDTNVIESEEDLVEIKDSDIIIDAMLGIGQSGELRERFKNVCRLINQSSALVIAIDSPTGYDNMLCTADKDCIYADITMLMAYHRVPVFFEHGADYFGEIKLCALEYPEDIVKDNHNSDLFVIKPSNMGYLLPPRNEFGNKRDQGVCAIISGSKGMLGAPELSAKAAMKSGIGLVELGIPESLLTIMNTKLTESVLFGLEDNDGVISSSSLDNVVSIMNKADASCLGPGLGLNSSTQELVCSILESYSGKLLLDADALNALIGNLEFLENTKAEVIITPHRGEWERLFGALPVNPHDKLTEIKKIAVEYGITILFKGPPSIICSPSGQTYLFYAPNSGMAKAGSGDVLAGIITSFWAQGADCFDALVLGVQLHAQAGKLATEALSVYSVLPSDIMNFFSEVFNEWLTKG